MPDPIVTAAPDALTLAPGESAQVTVEVDPNSPSGLGGVSIAVEVPPQYDYLIEGDTALTIGPGETGHITGDVSLTGDLIVEGLLTGINAFTLEGNGFQILVQNGGQVQFEGVPKTGWVPAWGNAVTGWNVGDRLAVAPTAASKTLPLALKTWTGAWGTMTRPTDAPDVTLFNGDVYKPEVANLDRSIKLNGLRRFHFHDGAGVQTLKHLSVINAGTQDVLAEYPIHFHLNGETSRGSLLEGVVVEGGKNHAFVPHGSHGITMRECVAYNTIGDVYWWDPLVNQTDPLDPNTSNDLLFDRCLSLHNDDPSNPPRLTAFFIGAGTNNRWRQNVAVGVQGGKASSGFRWTEHFVAVFNEGNLAHNNRSLGISTWTNSVALHVVDGFVSYRNRRTGIDHGAYVNPFIYRNVVIHNEPIVASGSDLTNAVVQHAQSMSLRPLLFENIQTNDRLSIKVHSVHPFQKSIHRNCTYTSVTYNEGNPAVETDRPSIIHYEDCGLVPADFTFVSIQPDSIIEIYEGGVLEHRWAGGWT